MSVRARGAWVLLVNLVYERHFTDNFILLAQLSSSKDIARVQSSISFNLVVAKMEQSTEATKDLAK